MASLHPLRTEVAGQILDAWQMQSVTAEMCLPRGYISGVINWQEHVSCWELSTDSVIGRKSCGGTDTESPLLQSTFMGFPSRIATELELQKDDLTALVGGRKQNHCKTQQVV